MRRIFLLAVVLLVLVGTGIITVHWTESGASVTFDKVKAREKAKQLVEKARQFKGKGEALADRRAADDAAEPAHPQ